jgi:hypothetical protein
LGSNLILDAKECLSYFIVPTNENGLILDTQIAADIRTALSLIAGFVG